MPSRPQCPICHRVFANSRSKRVHVIVQHQNAGRFKCRFCERTFEGECNREAHERVHTGDKPFRCQTCQREFNCDSNRKRHHRLVHEKNLKCKTYGKKSALRKHLARNSTKKPFQCKQCPASFTSKVRLQSHHVNVHAEKKFKCETCGAGFGANHLLKQHLETHSSERLKCGLCGSSFQHERNFKRHQADHRSGRITGRASDRSRKKARLPRIKDKEEYRVKSVQPNDGDGSAGAAYNLRARGKTSNHQDDNNEMSESDERQDSDDEPSKPDEATRDGDVLDEVKNGNQKKNFECLTCGKRFGRKWDRRRHEQCHSDKRFVCNVCKRLFKHKQSLRRHQAALHPDETSNYMSAQDDAESEERNEGKMSRIFEPNDSDDELGDPNEETRRDDVLQEAEQDGAAEEDGTTELVPETNTVSSVNLKPVHDENRESRSPAAFEDDSVARPETFGPQDDDQECGEEIEEPDGRDVSVGKTYGRRGLKPQYRVEVEDIVESDEDEHPRPENDKDAIPSIVLSSVEDDAEDQQEEPKTSAMGSAKLKMVYDVEYTASG